jgi:hypothetical protein
MINSTELFSSIKSTVNVIEDDLKQLNNTGIFFAPELFIAFCIGRDIYKNKTEIFGTGEMKWSRELNLGNVGPSDNCFETKDNTIVIEVKISDTKYSYVSDIIKLKKLTDPKYLKFFCVLIDSLIKKKDTRPEYLISKKEEQLRWIDEYSFPTAYSRYSSPTECHLILYQVT